MPQTTGSFSELLAPGLRKVFFKKFKDWPEEYSKWANMETSKRNYEEELITTGLGLMEQKPQGQSITFDQGIQGSKQRYTHVSYGLGFEITREMWDDDLYGVMNKLAAQLSRSARQTIELEWAGLFDDLFDGNIYQTVDGNPCCYSTGHPLLVGGTYANAPVSGADLSIAALRAAAERMERTIDDRGLPIMFKPSQLVVTPSYQWVADEILGSKQVPYSNENQPNSTQNILNLSYDVSHYMADDNMWILLAAKDRHDLKFFWRTRPRFENADDFRTGNAMFKVSCRFSLGFTDWRGVDGSKGA